MHFGSSISFPNELLISWTFLGHFCHHFWVGATAKQHQTHPKVMTKMAKKCSTDRRFIRKTNATQKIHTLVSELRAGPFKVKILYIVFLFRMNLESVENFLAIFVITFGKMQQQSNSKPTKKWLKKIGNWLELNSEKNYYL